MSMVVPLIGREALGPAKGMCYFRSGGVEDVCDVFDAMGTGT